VASLPVVSGEAAVRAFERAGWRRARQKGSHVSLVKPGVNVNLSVPLHRELDRGTLHKLIRLAGLSVDESS
jgi:predicted RNA binding protein YcfA (HicA-like mRNA interferase family)